MHTGPTSPDALLSEHASSIRRLARAIVADRDLADDVAQDASLVALRRPPPPGRSSAAWLAGIVRNVGRNSRRAAGRRRDHELGSRSSRESSSSPVDHLERLELQRALIDAVAALPETQRASISLHYFSGMTIDQIAEQLQVPRETVRTRVRTGLQKLRAQLQGSEQRPSARWGALLSLAGTHTTSRVLGVALVKKIAVVSLLILGLGGMCWWALGPSSEESGVESGATDVALQDRGPVLQGVTQPPAMHSPAGVDSSSTRLSGRVLVASDGTPVEGARVAVYDATTPEVHTVDARPLAVSRTAKDGTFAVQIRSNSAVFSVNASHPGHSPSASWMARGGSGTIWLYTPRRVRGQVVDARGQPVSQAHVRWLGVVGSVRHVVAAVTDDVGDFQFDVPRLRRFQDSLGAALDVTADGFAPHRVRFESVGYSRDGEDGIQIVLVRGATIRGKVLDAASDKPLAEAQVFLWAVGEFSGFHTFDGRSLHNPAYAHPLGSMNTRHDGSFAFSHVPAWTGQQIGVHTADSMVRKLGFLGVALPGYVTQTVAVQVPENGEALEFTVRVERAAVASGRVLDARGQPLAGARVDWFRPHVLVQPLAKYFPSAPAYGAISDEAGRYRLERVTVSDAQPIVVRARRSGPVGWLYADTVHIETNGEGVTVVPDLTLPDLPKWHFVDIEVVSEDGTPVSGAFVTGGVLGVEVRSPSLLRVLTPPPSNGKPKTATVVVQAIGRQPRKVEVTFASDPARSLRVALTRSAHPPEPVLAQARQRPVVALVGTLRDADRNEPVLKYAARLESENSKTCRSVFAGAGRFAFHDIANGEWLLTVTAPGYQEVTRSVQIDGDMPAEDLELTMRRGLSLRVRVRDPNNALIDGAALSFKQGRKYSEAILDGRGQATVRGLKPGVPAGVTARRTNARGQAQWYVLHPFRPTLEVPTANSGVMDLTLQRAGVATIRVNGQMFGYDQASATPEQVTVRKATKATLTDESGNMVWERMNLRGSGWSVFAPPGRYTLRVDAPGASLFEKAIDLTITASQVIGVVIE